VDGLPPALRVRGLDVAYGPVAALRGVDLDVEAGGAVAVLGPNGAGKTTLLRAVSGLLGLHGGRIRGGRIEVAGRDVTALAPPAIVRLGVGHVLEGRRVFADLTVEENLRAGAFVRRDRRGVRAAAEGLLAAFPVLARRRSAPAGYLSGGEQQLLAIARALMAGPRLLLLDEPSLGLAPPAVAAVREALARLHAQGTALLLVEQNTDLAAAVTGRACVLERGAVVPAGSPA
jgi:branched-chain amino acid transport system ATP-binding protein